MYILLFFAIFVIVYVASFKDNFSKEHIEKITPVLIIGTASIVLLCIMSSLLN